MLQNVKKANIVGAGILGLAHAKALAELGYKVTVFERNSRVIGSSIRNFGMIWPIGQHSNGNLSTALRSREIWLELCTEAKIWFNKTGSFQLLQHPIEWEIAHEFYQHEVQHRPGLKLLNKTETAAAIPQAHKNNVMGSLYSDSEVIVESREALRLIPGFLNQKWGIDFHFSTVITECKSNRIKDNKNNQYEADLTIVANGYETQLLFPEYFEKGPFTISQLNMLRTNSITQNLPPICGGLSFLHYPSYAVSNQIDAYRIFCQEKYPKQIDNGIHLLISQNHKNELTIGDSHVYGSQHDPFQETAIDNYILDYMTELLDLDIQISQTWLGEYLKLTNKEDFLFHEIENGIYIANGTGGAGMTLSWGLAEKNIQTLIAQ